MPDAILGGVVGLGTFERRWGVYRREFTRLRWTRADVIRFLADWPDLAVDGAGALASRAQALTVVGATPDEARAWLRALYRTVNGWPGLTDEAADWLNDRGHGPGEWRVLVRSYAQAVDGDHVTGRLAYLANLDVAEVAAGHASGRCSRQSLAALVALRGLAVG